MVRRPLQKKGPKQNNPSSLKPKPTAKQAALEETMPTIRAKSSEERKIRWSFESTKRRANLCSEASSGGTLDGFFA